MSIFLEKASEEQKKVIVSEFKNNYPIVIIAWAWSGKTTTIINKIWYSIEKWINPQEILAMSFSNKSAKEIKDRVQNKIWNKANWITCWTFHSIALNILKTNIPEFRKYKILDQEDDKKYIKKIYDKYFWPTIKDLKKEFKEWKIEEEEFMFLNSLISSLNDIQWCIARSKNTNENIYNVIFDKIVQKQENIAITRPLKYNTYDNILFSEEEYNIFIEKVVKFSKEVDLPKLFFENLKYTISTIKEYENNKKRDKYNSFDDLLVNIVKFLNKNDLVRKNIDKKYKYIYVDEFQDVNFIQFEFLKLINKDFNYLIVVWDWDQAIYSFRWCDSYYFTNMKNIYPNTRIFYLNDNYRSDWQIVAVANHLIKNNQFRYEKEMNNIKDIVNPPILLESNEEKHLFEKIVQKIKAINNFEETAILYRNNSHNLEIQKELIKNRIPFKVVWWQNILNKKYSKDIRAFLSILSSIDPISLERVLTVFPSVWKKTAETFIAEISGLKENENTLFDVWKEWQIDILAWHKTLNKLYEFMSNFFSNKKTLAETLNDFKSILEKDIDKKIKIDKIEYEKEILEEVINIILELYNNWNTIEEILEKITLDNLEEKEEHNVVTLSTIHRAKWLEWENVFIIKAYKNIFPWFQSMQSNFLLEEERNLFYVAITRAKNNLYFWIANYYFNWFEEKSIIQSMFIDEIFEYLE